MYVKRTMTVADGLSLILSVCLIQQSVGTKYFLTVPQVPSYDANVTAVVTAFQHTSQSTEKVLLQYIGGENSKNVLNSTHLSFDQDGSQQWTVTFSSESMQELRESSVVLQMTCNGQKKEILLTFRQSSGYIFIQTDKPIYTPGQTVKFRVIAVDEDQRLSKHHLKVDIINDQQVTVDRMRYSAEDAFKGQNFELPKDIAPGRWYISANFEGLDSNYRLAHNVSIEVREYVLPRFSATLHANTSVITKDSKALKLTVTSKYVFGRPVHGNVEIHLGILDNNKLLPHAVLRGKLQNGQFSQDVDVNILTLSKLMYTSNQRLHVGVNVIEKGTFENYTLTDSSIFISHPYYIVDLKSSKEFFKPGFSYTLKAVIKTKVPLTVSHLDLYIFAEFLDANDNIIKSVSEKVPIMKNTIVTQDFITPKTAEKINFKVHVVDENHPSFEHFHFTVKKYISANHEYLHINMSKFQPVMKWSDGVFFLEYTKSAYLNSSSLITVNILSKGQVIYSINVKKNILGVSPVSLPKQLFGELSPAYRIVAYYYIAGAVPELVADSLLVDTELDTCVDEVYLIRDKFSQFSPVPKKPKDKLDLLIIGSPLMKIGLLAVDKAIFLLNDKQTLTRELLFHTLGSHDPSTSEGDGLNAELILENSGLYHMMVDTDAYSTSVTPRRALSSFGSFYDISFDRINMPEENRHGNQVSEKQPETEDSLPQRSDVRFYFPETWLFEEKIIPRDRKLPLELSLPDSITTWSFVAVGLSNNRGICVSIPLEQVVEKPVFLEVRMPFKASRLEELNINIIIHNYHTNDVRPEVTIIGDSGLCFAENATRGGNHSDHGFNMTVTAGEMAERTVRIIPLKIGELTLKVSMISHLGNDTVEKKLRVIAEGLRVRKAITFVLDPGAKHTTFMNYSDNNIQQSNTATIQNRYIASRNMQHTTIDLALPPEVIKGTESCQISAFGDLMGDIITHAVVQSKGLMEEPTLIAQEVLNDLGPIVHALNYINDSGLMTHDLKLRSHRFIRHGVVRLLTYKSGKAFSVRPGMKPATWLSALILKSLCHATSLAFIDKHNLIDTGFSWLQDQIKKDGSLNELDWTGRKNNAQYRIELAAEVLISVLECNRKEKEDHLTLQDKMADYLQKHIDKIKLPVVMAKTAYALMLYNSDSNKTLNAVDKLKRLALKGVQGHIYWANKPKDEDEKKPHWYIDRVPESSIEATAYGLLVFLRKKNLLNVDAVADWLVAQRKHNGAFNGAKDSTAAIQALTEYSLQKHKEEEIKVNMNLTVRAGKAEKNQYKFKFTQENATQPESRSNVPVYQFLEVLTEGQGLGQMQINVEYNIPVDKNEDCSFNISVEVKTAKIALDSSNLLCSSCDFNCPGAKINYNIDDTIKDRTAISKTVSMLTSGRNPKTNAKPKTKKNKPKPTKQPRRRPQLSRKPKPHGKRSKRALSSGKSYCVTVCIRHLQGVSRPVDVRIQMLTGIRPLDEDVRKISQTIPNVIDARLTENAEFLIVKFSKVEATKNTCFAYRARVENDATRINGANIEIIQENSPKPSCVLEYHPPEDKESLKVYCADYNHINRGECKCFSGQCGKCGPMTSSEFDLDKTIKLTCKADLVYQLKLGSQEDKIHWLEINATVHSVNKTTGTHELKEGDEIIMMSPGYCMCFRDYFGKEEKFYLLSSDVDRLMDRQGTIVHRYVLDENTTLLRVSQPLSMAGHNNSKSEQTKEIFISQPLNKHEQDLSPHFKLAVSHEHLAAGLSQGDKCEL
nr:complement protein C3-2 [Biomphalaria glabrata]